MKDAGMRTAMTFRRAFLATSFFTAGAFGVGVLVNALLDQASASLARPEAPATASAPEREAARPAEVRVMPAPAAAAPDAAHVSALFGPSILQQAAPVASTTTAAAYAPSP